MSNPEVVAFLEDNVPLSHEVEKRLLGFGISCRIFTSRDAFKQSIERGDRYDAVILDWFFEDPTSPIVARLVLEDLRTNRFVPVLIYTEQPDAVEAELPNLLPPFNRVVFFDKETTDPAKLAEELTRWYAASLGARLSAAWREARRRAFEQSLYELDALEGADFYRTLRRILVMDAGEIPDVDHALEFLERYVGRKILGNSSLREELRNELLEAQKLNIKVKGELETALVHAHRYLLPEDSIARTGDVVEVFNEKGNVLSVAVVLTPACDLAQQKCFELRLVLAEEREGNAQGYSEWELPAVRGKGQTAYRNFRLNFHKTFFVKDASIGNTNEERKGRLIAYDHTFVDHLGSRLSLKPICRLDDPYRSDLLQRYSAHASRVGIP